MGRIHVIKDESLGGIEREYVEVGRKADVGDYVIITDNVSGGYSEGDIAKVTRRDVGGKRYSTDGVRLNDKYDHSDDEYKTLEPTDIVHVDSVRYRMVERKAEVEEMVVIVDNAGKPDYNGRLGEVIISCDNEGISVNIGDDVGYYPYVFDEEYRVLVPLSAVADDELLTVDETQASQEVIDLLANLARRVTSLEAQLKDTQANVERQAQEHEGLAKLVGTKEKPVVINTSNITVNKDADIDVIIRELAKRLEIGGTRA